MGKVDDMLDEAVDEVDYYTLEHYSQQQKSGSIFFFCIFLLIHPGHEGTFNRDVIWKGG